MERKREAHKQIDRYRQANRDSDQERKREKKIEERKVEVVVKREKDKTI